MTPLARKLALAVGILLALVGAFSAGRFTAPERVQTVDRWNTLDLTTQDLTRGYTFARTVERTVWRNVTTTTTDAGTVTVDRTVEHEGSATASTSTERDQSTRSSTQASEQTRQVTLRPDWRAGALVGGRFSAGPAGVVAGGIVERRILGGVSAGLWGLVEIDTRSPVPAVTSGIVGGALTLEF